MKSDAMRTYSKVTEVVNQSNFLQLSPVRQDHFRQFVSGVSHHRFKFISNLLLVRNFLVVGRRHLGGGEHVGGREVKIRPTEVR